MQYFVEFNMVALLFLAIICWRFFRQEPFPLRSTKLFALVLVVSVADVLFDTLSIFMLEHLDTVPVGLFYLVNGTYYVMQIALPTALVVYVLTLVQTAKRFTYRTFALALLPMIVSELVVLIGMPLNLVFYISASGDYLYGPLSIITYCNAFVYLGIALCSLFLYRKDLPKELILSLLVVIPLLCLLLLAQAFNPNVLITGVAITASLLVMFFTLHEPNRMRDTITDAFNYAAFLLMLRERWNDAHNMCLIVFDVHGLRTANLNFGNEAGNYILRRLRLRFQEEGSYFFRLNGTRFALITMTQQAFNVSMSTLRSLSDNDWRLENGVAHIDISACYTRGFDRFESPERLQSIIEKVLGQQSANEQLHRIQEIDDELLEQIGRTDSLTTALRASLEGDYEGFELWYQPLFNVQKQRFDAAEALLRYHHPVLGDVSPGEFVALIEQDGLATMMDEMVVSLALRDVSSGLFEGLDFDHVHVNLSGASFATDRVTKNILSWIEEGGVDPRFISFEITETIAVRASRMIDYCTHLLVDQGIRLALDDFGSGYSNLLRLSKLPFAIVKIDQSILDAQESLLKSLIEMLLRAGKKVVVEGVETAEQAQTVSSLGANAIQGFFYARPMPAARLRDFVLSAVE